MRILVTIPHFYDPKGDANARHGSLKKDSQSRILALKLCLESLHQLFGKAQYGFSYAQGKVLEANCAQQNQIDIVVCTTGDRHILDQLPNSLHFYEHHDTKADPPLLGFECQAVLAECIGKYDYYCFLEDDLILQDPWFFTKLSWFTQTMGDSCLLQPNRYELSNGSPVRKIYIDGDLKSHLIPLVFGDRKYTQFTGQVMGKSISLQPALNPHSGCYFLNSAQMTTWMNQPYFLERDISFIGPLESAASLGAIRTFKIYKPALADANFLEIQHFGDVMSQHLLEAIATPESHQTL
jgi:hypothetical protein